MSWTKEKIEQTVKECHKKSATDGGFRAEMIANPHAAIEKVSGLAVDKDFRIQIVDLNTTDMFIPLPRSASDELSDSQLEAVAGGKGEEAEEVFVDFCGAFGALMMSPEFYM